jgi:glycosyltransferase involved in cell wall biosynthesis
LACATHDADFQLVLPALETLAQEYPGMFALTIIGAVRSPVRHSWITKINPPTDSTSYPRFARWLLEQRAFDIGLAPLVANRFNDCKSDLKILDYGALGIVPVVSDGRTYRDTAQASGAAILVQNDVAGWTECLREILRNRAHLPDMAEAAHDYVWEARDVSRLARLQVESIERLI